MKFPWFRSKPKPVYKTGGELFQSVRVMPGHAEAIREATAANRKMLRMYEAAMTNNLNADFQPTIGSANAEVLVSLYISRGRSRTLTKDNPTARGIVRTFKNNVCGDDPFRLEMKVGKWSADGKKFTPEKKTNRMIEEAWKEAGKPKNCTVRRNMSRMEMYQMVEASALREGGVIARHHRDFPNNKFHYALEFIETDRLQESYQGRNPENGNVIRFSIELDKYSAPVAYWIMNRHPGDLFEYNGPQAANVRQRIPAEDIIAFHNLRDRAEQDVGMPEFDSVMQYIHRDRQFDVAHVTAAIWSACKPFFIIQEFPTGMPYVGDPSIFVNAMDGLNQNTTNGQNIVSPGGDPKGGGANRIKAVEPASGEILPYGQKPMLVDPKFPVESATGFKQDSLRAIATGVGLSYQAVSGNYEGMSFSSGRLSEQPQRDYFKVRQAHMVLSFVEDHFNAWLENAILSGALKLPISRLEEFQAAAVFHPKRWPYVNPLQDAQTDIMLREANLKSGQEIMAESENGRNYEDVHAEIAAEKESEEAHGIQAQEDVTLPTVKKGEPGQVQPAPDKNGNVPAGSKSKNRSGQRLTTHQILMLNGNGH